MPTGRQALQKGGVTSPFGKGGLRGIFILLRCHIRYE
jgi:hypothetical protein